MKNTYRDDNINLVSFLLVSQKIKLLDINEDSPRHFIFILSDAPKCEELKQEYLNGGSAPAQELFMKRDMLIGEIKRRNKLT